MVLLNCLWAELFKVLMPAYDGFGQPALKLLCEYPGKVSHMYIYTQDEIVGSISHFHMVFNIMRCAGIQNVNQE